MTRRKKTTSQDEQVKSRDLQSTQEWREMVYDYYKQLLTLSTAGIAVVLAIYEQDIFEKDFVRGALANFALCAFFALLGLTRHVGWFPYQREPRRPYMPSMAQAATVTLVFGLGLIIAEVTDPPNWLAFGGLAIASLALLWVVFGERIKSALQQRVGR